MSDIPPHDSDSLWKARVYVRIAQEQVKRLPQADPTLRCIATKLDDLCIEITEAIELENPRLPLAFAKQAEYEAKRKAIREEWETGVNHA